MEKISYKLDVFEGPLDLLIHLIKLNKVDICDIPIALLLSQYLEYVEQFKLYNPDNMSDFIDMASTLILIKSKMLLPRSEPDEDPRGELVDMISEYLKYKQAAAHLAERTGFLNSVFIRMPMNIDFQKIYEKSHSPNELCEAYLQAVKKVKGKLPPPVETFTAYVSTKVVSVSSKINFVLRKLITNGKIKFSALFMGSKTRSDIVATFLAVLELSKTNRINIADPEDDEVLLSLNKRLKEAFHDGNQ